MNELSIDQSGYRLGVINAPWRIGDAGQLSFQIIGSDERSEERTV